MAKAPPPPKPLRPPPVRVELERSVCPMVPPVEVVGGELPFLTLGEFLMFGAGVAVGTFLTYFTMR